MGLDGGAVGDEPTGDGVAEGGGFGHGDDGGARSALRVRGGHPGE